MNPPHIRRSVQIGTLAAYLMVLAASPVNAADVAVDAPDQVTVGETVTVTATVTEDGEPIVGGDLALAFVSRFGGKAGWLVVDTGTTDDVGTVTFEYLQRSLDGERMRVEYLGPDGQENTGFEVEVVDGDQLYESEAGADIPILGVWWLLVLLGIVWTLLLLAVAWLLRVGRSSDLAAGPAKVIPRVMVGFVAFTSVGMFLVVLTRPQSHANLDPAGSFDRVTPAVVGAQYDYPGMGGDGPDPVFGGGVGESIYVRSGCAGCHGLVGGGAVVGGTLVDERGVDALGDFLDEVREGPKGMPAYAETTLSDDDVRKIHDYIGGAGSASG